MTGFALRRRTLGAAAALGAALAAAQPAAAADTIIGGGAEQCSREAKAGIATPLSIETCTTAITSEILFGHTLAATYVNRGTMYIGVRNYGSALNDLNEAVRIEPGLGVAYVNRGGALIGLKRYQEALDDINKGLELGPEEPEKAYGNRALARWNLDDVKGAYDDFMKAAELKPGWEWPAQQLANFKIEPRAER